MKSHRLALIIAFSFLAALAGQVGPIEAATNNDKAHILNDTPFYDPHDQIICGEDPSTQGGGTIPLVGNDNAQKAFNYFVQQLAGVHSAHPKEQAAGIVGNLMQESNVNPGAVNTAGGTGGSIAQWEGARWTAFLNWAKGKDPHSLQVQLDYMWYELTHNENAALKDLLTQSTAAASAQSFSNKYERPDPNYANIANRVRYAEQILARYGGSAPTTGGSGTPAPIGGDSGAGNINGDANTCASNQTTGGDNNIFLGDTPCGSTTGTVQELATRIYNCPRIQFQSTQERADFAVIQQTGRQTGCGGVAISSKLLGVLLALTNKYQFTIGVLVTGHSCDSGFHPKGMAADLNGVISLDGSVHTGPDGHYITYQETGAAMNLLKSFYGDIGKLLATTGGGGLGQQQCFPGGAPKVSGVVYFDDACSHIHMDVGKR
jgi:hypothetical protein